MLHRTGCKSTTFSSDGMPTPTRSPPQTSVIRWGRHLLTGLAANQPESAGALQH